MRRLASGFARRWKQSPWVFRSSGHACQSFLGKDVLVVERSTLTSDDETEIHEMVLDVGEDWGKSYYPGQFVMVRLGDGDERIPLTVTKFDPKTGHMWLVFQVAGLSTKKLSRVEPGDRLEDITYPLGTPLDIHEPEKGKDIVVVVAGGVGIAPAYAKTDAFHRAGFDVRMILGARNEDLLILQDDMYESVGLAQGKDVGSEKVLICTDDGSFEGNDVVSIDDENGIFGVQALNHLIDYPEKNELSSKLLYNGSTDLTNSIDYSQVAEIFAVGPLPMMQAVAEAGLSMGIDTYASLNTVMVDGSGMCGGCRVTFEDADDFYVCADGPTAPVKGIDWDTLRARGQAYVDLEDLSQLVQENDMDKWTVGDTEDIYDGNYVARIAERFALGKDTPISTVMKGMSDQFQHVAGFLSLEEAINTTYRCTCPENGRKKPCQKKCPVNIDIQEFIGHVKKDVVMEKLGISNDDEMDELLRLIEENPENVDPEIIEKVDRQVYSAFQTIKSSNPIPEITGLVCPQESQCQMKCASSFKKELGEPTPIGKLEAFIARWIRVNSERIRQYKWYSPPEIKSSTGNKVMIIGSGPSGLVAAAELAKKGHDVTVFETLHEAGGVLVYGIPEFRLPKGIVRYEIEQIAELGVKFEMNQNVSSLYEHMERYNFDAAFVGTGAGTPVYITEATTGKNIKGQDLVGVFSANEFLTRVNLMKGYLFPLTDTPPPDVVGKNVVVFGGGNVAMDSARCALRLGAKNVTIMYRRSSEEVPARAEEFEHAQHEGIEFHFLASPVELLGEDGALKKIKFQRMEKGEPDESGRSSVFPIENDFGEVDADIAVVAVGQGPNGIMDLSIFDCKRGRIIVDEDSMLTNLDGVFAGGDAVYKTGGTVIYAAGTGLKASDAIDEYLRKK